MLDKFRATIEYYAGERDQPANAFPRGFDLLLRCTLLVVAIVLIYAFSGQSSKFIYIDF